MSSCVLIALAVATSQTNSKPPKPVIIQMNLGLARQTFTGRASGWPFRPGHWNWFSATVYNPVDRDLDGALTFYTASPRATGQFGATKEFRLPARSALRVSFPVRSSPPKILGVEPSYGVVQLKIDGAVADEKRTEISYVEENVYAIGVLGDSKGLQSALDAQPLYPTRGPEFQSAGVVRSVTLHDNQIPENPLGLDFLHALIVVHPSQHELRPGQWAAIDDWVQVGGNVVFVLGTDESAHAVPDVRPMLPAYSTGSRRVTILPSLAEWSGESLEFPAGFEVAEPETISGRPVVREGDIPLVVRSRRGRGGVSCVALTVEDGLSSVAAYRQFWLEVLRYHHQPPSVDVARLEPFASSIVEQFAGRRVAGVWLPVGVLAGYFIVLWLLLRGSTSRWQRETRWIGVCGAAVAFTVGGAILVGASRPAPASDVFDIWIARGASPSRMLSLSDYLSILPASRGDSTVRVNNPGICTVPTLETGATVVESSVNHEGPSIRYQAEKARIRTLQLEGQVPVDGLSARAKATSDALVLEVENRTLYDLDKAFFKLGRRAVSVGRIARNGHETITIGPATGTTSMNQYEADQILDSSARLRHLILGTLFVDPSMQSDENPLTKNYRGSNQGTSSGFLFAGWVNRPLLDVSPSEPAGDVTSHALGLVTIEPEWEIEDSTFLVPRGAMTMRLQGTSARSYYFGRSTFRGEHPTVTALNIEFAVPAWGPPAEIEASALFIQFSAEAYRLIVKVGDERLPLPEVPSGRFPIPAASLKSQRGGAIQFDLVVERKAGFDDDATQGHRWSLREFEVECTCRRLPDNHD